MGKRKLSDDDREEIRKLAEEGFSYKKLASQYNVSIATIMRTCRPDIYEAHLEASKQYSAKNSQRLYQTRKAATRRYPLTFRINDDAAIIAHLDQQDNVQAYIRSLVEKELKSNSE